MATDSRTLKKSYLREAKTGGRSTTAAQLAWLETKRVEFQAEVDGGDWAVVQQGVEGANHSATRGIPAMDRLAAVMAALEDLENSSGTAINRNRPGLLIPQFSAGGLHT